MIVFTDSSRVQLYIRAGMYVIILLVFISHTFPLQMNGHNLLQGGGDWTNVIIPGNAQNSGFNHKKTYEVTNLKTDAEYECLVQARNQFGWSEASRIFHFFTGKQGIQNQIECWN